MKRGSLAFCVGLLMAGNVCSQTVMFDSTFNNTGYLVTDLTYSNDQGRDVLIQPDGKIIVAGSRETLTNGGGVIVRYQSNGTVESYFNNSGAYEVLKWNAIALQPDGKLVAAGKTYSSLVMGRFKSDGTADSSFGVDGLIFSNVVDGNDVAIQSDGKIVVAGYFGISGSQAFSVVRVNADGTPDNTFDTDGIAYTLIGNDAIAQAVAIQADGKILLAGASLSNNKINIAAVRYLTDGSVDSTFDGDGIVVFSQGTKQEACYGIAIQDDGKILISGYDIGGNNTATVVRLNVDGSPDTSFDGDGQLLIPLGSGSSYAFGIGLQPDQKIVVTGYGGSVSSNDAFVSRFNADGSPDASFNSTGIVLIDVNSEDDFGYGLAIQPSDLKIVMTGSSEKKFQTDLTLVRLNPDGAFDNQFNETGILMNNFGQNNEDSYSVLIQPDGKIITTGDIAYGYSKLGAVMRLLEDGTIDSTFEEDGVAIIMDSVGIWQVTGNTSLLQPDGKIIVAGTREKFNSSLHYFELSRLASDGLPDSSFNATGKVMTDVFGVDIESNLSAVALQPDGKIIAVGYGSGGFNNNGYAVLRYNSDGSLDNSFDGDGKLIFIYGLQHDQPFAVLIQPDGKIVMVGKSDDYITLFRLNSDGSFDNSFGNGGKFPVYGLDPDFFNYNPTEILIQPDGKLIVSGNANNLVMRINSNGTMDSTFLGEGIRAIFVANYEFGTADVLLEPDGKILVASWANYSSGAKYLALVRYTADGYNDASFGTNGVAFFNIEGYDFSIINSIIFQPDGKLVGTGTSLHYGNGYDVDRMTLRLLNDVATGSNAIIPETGTILYSYPNPVEDMLSFQYLLSETSNVTLKLTDMQGNIVWKSPSEKRNKGWHQQECSLSSVSSGIYLLQLIADGKTATQKIVKQ